jgi:uncharacterized protein (DUF2344 family)
MIKERDMRCSYIGVGGFIPSDNANLIDEFEMTYGSQRVHDIVSTELDRFVDFDKLIDTIFADIVADLDSISLEAVDTKFYSVYCDEFFRAPENQDKYAKNRIVSLNIATQKRIVDGISSKMLAIGSTKSLNWWLNNIDLSFSNRII